MSIDIFCGGAGLTEIFARKIYDVPLGKERPTIFDCGANAGLFTLWANRRWNEAKILSYEPLMSNYCIAKSNIERNAPSHRIHIHNKAVSKQVGRAYLNVGRNPGLSSLLWQSTKTAQREEVETTTVQAEMEAYEIDYVDLLKLDVEGSEIDALLGVDLTRMGYIAMEHHHRDGGAMVEGILRNTHRKTRHEGSIMVFEPIRQNRAIV